jgi:hypothetical protein
VDLIPPHTDPHLVKAAKWINLQWPQLVSIIGGVGISAVEILPTLYNEDWSVIHRRTAYAFWLSMICIIVGGIASIIRTQRAEVLLRRMHDFEEDYPQIINDQLSILANQVLKLEDTDRISIYKHDGRAFIKLGRYSKNPEYAKQGRSIYPDNEGCIGEAWLNGFSFIDGLPDPAQDLENYLERLKQDYRIAKEVARNFKMKSRNFAAYAIEDSKGDRRIAIIVVESVNIGAFNETVLRRALEKESGRMARLLERYRSIEPTPTVALKEGY